MERLDELLEIVRSDERLVKILETAREVNLPDWYVGAGVVRNTVWDFLSDQPRKTLIRDIDLVYYSSDEMDEAEIRLQLEKAIPNVEWDIHNSAFVHKWYKEKKGIERKPLESAEEDIYNWPELCSCVGLRLLDDGEIVVCAPHGLNDLLNMVFRINSKGDGITRQIFDWRVVNKHITERWPKVKIIYD